MKTIDILKNIVRGACFLGSGGGGGYQTGMKFVDDYLRERPDASLKISAIDEVDSKKTGIIVAYMGAPEKMQNVQCPDAVIAGINKFLEINKTNSPDLNIDYIIPVEIGPISSAAACLASMALDIPVLDLDGAGRAVPTLDLITYSTNGGISVNPTILSSENIGTTEPKYHQIILEISDDTVAGAASKMESLARPVLSMSEFDQKAGLVMWYFDDVRKLKDENVSIKGTLTICRELGEIIYGMQQSESPEMSKIQTYFNSLRNFIYGDVYEFISEKCSGKLLQATTQTSGGFDLGTITIESGEHIYRILFQNESLILWDSKSPEPLIMAPDLISYLIKYDNEENEEDIKHQLVYTNDDIMENGKLRKELVNADITVYGIRAPKELRETEKNVMKLRNLLREKYLESDESALPKQYMSILNTLGYYGEYLPLKK